MMLGVMALVAMLFLFVGVTFAISVWVGLWPFYLAMAAVFLGFEIIPLVIVNLRERKPPLYSKEPKRHALRMLFGAFLFGACMVFTRWVYE